MRLPCKAELRFYFYEDKLYNLNFKLVRSYNYDIESKDRDREDSISQAAIEDDLYSKINSSYQKSSYYDYDPVSLGGTMFIADWFKGNQIIEFKKFSPIMMEAEISYINAPINNIVSDEESSKRQDEYNARSRMKDIGIENSTYDGSVSKVEAYLKSNLKDDKSYESVEWSNVTPTDNGYMVRHKYRAKNSFGAYELVNQVFYLDNNGAVLGVSAYK